jgi:MFS transporter, Spinster family, sphingosine-1-phosphate transporter
VRGARYKWLLVALLWAVALLNYLDRQMIFSVFPLLQKELDVSNVQLGLLGTSFLWVYGFLSPVGGYVADRFNRRAVILGSLAVWSAVTWLTGLATSYGQLLAARGLMGISEAFYLPAALALIADYHGEDTRARATGLHQSGLYAGILLGGAGGGWIGDHYGWRAAFVAMGLAGLLYALPLGLVLREVERKGEGVAGIPFRDAMRDLLRSHQFLLVVVVNCLVSIAYWCVYTWLALYLFERFGMSLTAAGFSSTFYIQAAAFAGIILGGWMADEWTRTEARARVLTQTLGLAAAGPFLFLVGWTGSRWVLLPCLVLFGLGRGFFDCNLMPVVCQIVSPRLRATAYGILNFTSTLVGGGMALAAGVMKDTVGLGGALQFSAAMLTAGALLLWTVRPMKGRN